jgi:hypothetical protein
VWLTCGGGLLWVWPCDAARCVTSIRAPTHYTPTHAHHAPHTRAPARTHRRWPSSRAPLSACRRSLPSCRRAPSCCLLPRRRWGARWRTRPRSCGRRLGARCWCR